jgi:DNA uptake protein ComE-like DNA-binding protein
VQEGGSVDLNTGSVEDLNRLGAGMIGRRIVGGRPYASPEDLVNRRVLTRKDFDRIKAQIVVQTSPVANP